MRRSVNLQRFLVLGLSGPVVILNLWLLSQVFLYFQHLITIVTVAAILAFLLNYAVQLLERLRISRTQAVIAVLLLTLALLVILAVTLLPIIGDQSAQLLNRIPGLLESSRQNLALIDTWARRYRLPLDLQGFSGRINSQLESQVQLLASQALGVAWGTVSGFVDGVLVIVLAFYMLLYGDRLWQGLIHLFPPRIGIPLSRSLRQNFQNFFISQLLLGMFMFGTLTPMFLALHVPFALLFALLIGIAELIPFIGATLGIGLVTILVMLQDFRLALLVAGLSIVMQQIKDNVLAPKLMGDFTGLNPIWILVSVLVGAQVAGLLGVIVAVPIAGTIKGMIEALRPLRSRAGPDSLRSNLSEDRPFNTEN